MKPYALYRKEQALLVSERNHMAEDRFHFETTLEEDVHHNVQFCRNGFTLEPS